MNYTQTSHTGRVLRIIQNLKREGWFSLVEKIAREAGLPLACVLGRERRREVSLARHRALAVLKWTTGASYPKIGRAFCLDHSTVISAERKYMHHLNQEFAR